MGSTPGPGDNRAVASGAVIVDHTDCRLAANHKDCRLAANGSDNG